MREMITIPQRIFQCLRCYQARGLNVVMEPNRAKGRYECKCGLYVRHHPDDIIPAKVVMVSGDGLIVGRH